MPVLGAGPDAPWTVCDVAACGGVTAAEGGLCLAHLGPDGQAAWLAGLAPGADLDARGVAFDRDLVGRLLESLPVGADGRRRLGTVRLDGASFAAEVNLDSTTIEGPASFRGARFAAQARFAEATFAGPADFSKADFGGLAWFVGASFEDKVSFSGATSTGPVWLRAARFRGAATFDGARFGADVHGQQASFDAAASFAGTSFGRGARFDDDAFAGGADFEGATFARKHVIPKAAQPIVDAAAAERAATGMLAPPIAAPPPVPSLKTTLRKRWPVALTVLVVAATAIVVTRGEGTEPGFTPPALGDATRFGFVFDDPVTGQPARYNPCAPVRYVVNPHLGPEDWEPVVTDAIAQLSSATGMKFEFAGVTTEAVKPDRMAEGTDLPRSVDTEQQDYEALFGRELVQPDRYGAGWAPVLIEWAPLGTDPLADDDGDTPTYEVAGVGMSVPQDTREGPVYVSGVAALNTNVARRDLQTALMHELGHVLGLAHVNDSFSVMQPSTRGGLPKWSAGDLAGLRKVGRPAGCLTTPDPPASL